jgi:hypothetical protein
MGAEVKWNAAALRDDRLGHIVANMRGRNVGSGNLSRCNDPATGLNRHLFALLWMKAIRAQSSYRFVKSARAVLRGIAR